jgi:hypothetical protein
VAVGLEFCLLGPLVVRRDGIAVPVPGGKPRAVLAALLLDASELVTVGQLAEVLWGADPPPSARVSVQNHVKRLRQALGEAGRPRIVTRPGGYLMHLEAGELDVSRFQDSLARAQAAARDRRWEQVSAQAAALLLWRGEPRVDAGSELLAGVPLTTVNSWSTGASLPRDLDQLAAVGAVLARWVGEDPMPVREWERFLEADQSARAALGGGSKDDTGAGRLIADLTDPFALEVHRPVIVDSAAELPLLPPYVQRAHDAKLAQVAAQAAGS